PRSLARPLCDTTSAPRLDRPGRPGHSHKPRQDCIERGRLPFQPRVETTSPLPQAFSRPPVLTNKRSQASLAPWSLPSQPLFDTIGEPRPDLWAFLARPRKRPPTGPWLQCFRGPLPCETI